MSLLRKKTRGLSLLVMICLLFLAQIHGFQMMPTKASIKNYGLKSSSSSATIKILPEAINVTVGQIFTVSVVVENVEGLYGFDIQLKWDPEIIRYINHTTTIPAEDYPPPNPPSPYGGILYKGDGMVMEVKNIVDENDAIPDAEPGTMGFWVYSCVAPAPPFDGNGTIVIINFEVVGQGSTDIEFVKVPGVTPMLSDKDGNPIDFTVKGASIEQAGTPIANFDYWPSVGVVNRAVWFNATLSYDVDGYIVQYKWNFGDGNVTSTEKPIISHNYTTAGEFTVSLVVVDNDTISSKPVYRTVRVCEVRELEVANIIIPTNYTAYDTHVTISVTVENNGDVEENCTLSIYYNSSAISTSQWVLIESRELSIGAKSYIIEDFEWHITGIPKNETYYYILANITRVPYELNETNNQLISSKGIFVTEKTIHDLSLISLTFKPYYGENVFSAPAILGENVYVEALVKNEGTVPEQSFNLTFYINGTEKATLPISEEVRPQGIISASWSWIDIESIGRYNVTVVLVLVGDNDTDNNVKQGWLRVIDTPTLHVSYSPTSPEVNETVTFSAVGSTHNDPNGNITEYSWQIRNPQGTIVATLKGIEVTYKFPSAGNWTVILTVKDNYGVTYSSKRAGTTSDYRLSVTVVVSGPGEVGPPGLAIPMEYIVAIVAAVIIVAVAIYIYRKRRLTEIQE